MTPVCVHLEGVLPKWKDRRNTVADELTALVNSHINFIDFHIAAAETAALAVWATRPQKAKMLRVGGGPVADWQAKLLMNNDVTGVTGL